MKHPFWLPIAFAIILIASVLNAQSLIPEITPSAYKAAIENELTQYGGSRYEGDFGSLFFQAL